MYINFLLEIWLHICTEWNLGQADDNDGPPLAKKRQTLNFNNMNNSWSNITTNLGQLDVNVHNASSFPSSMVEYRTPCG